MRPDAVCRGLKTLRKAYDHYQHVKHAGISAVITLPLWSLKETGICAAKLDSESRETELLNARAGLRVSWGLGKGFPTSPAVGCRARCPALPAPCWPFRCPTEPSVALQLRTLALKARMKANGFCDSFFFVIRWK